MAETVRAVVQALERDQNADVVRAVLMGARGNSGVILSQLVRGAAEALPDVERVDTAALAAALRHASDTAYAAVRQPQEGTILTLARNVPRRSPRRIPRSRKPSRRSSPLVRRRSLERPSSSTFSARRGLSMRGLPAF
jgi:dihydroxyacetone kinase-like predicted kinase